MKTRNESLENQIRDAVGKRKKKEETLLERIEGLKLELKVMKEKIALLLREYQELLNIMSLGGGRGGMAISASMNASSASVSAASGNRYGAELGGALSNGRKGNGGDKEAPDGAVEVKSTESQTESYEEQSVEMTERKTLLIRTVKTEDMYESDTQERTITISGAADDTDED
ncbi:unnamed protein product [Coregonus sp. 'balchen']|nr:unnamed protein product [Coregonus sp. 'balchen']